MTYEKDRKFIAIPWCTKFQVVGNCGQATDKRNWETNETPTFMNCAEVSFDEDCMLGCDVVQAGRYLPVFEERI
jgi:hypothetical protein